MFYGASIVLNSLKSVNIRASKRLILKRFLSTECVDLSNLLEKCLSHNETNGYVMRSPYGSVSVPNMTLDQYVWRNVSSWQNHIAIECGFTKRKYTYAKLRDHCAALAIRLRHTLKLQANDIVAICLPNVPGK